MAAYKTLINFFSGEAEKTTDTFLKNTDTFLKNTDVSMKYDDELYQNNDDFSLINVAFSLQKKKIVQEMTNIDVEGFQKDIQFLDVKTKSDFTLEEDFDSQNDLKSSSNDFIPLFWMLIPSIIIIIIFVSQ